MADRASTLHRLYLRRRRNAAWRFDSGWSAQSDAENAARFYRRRGYQTEIREEPRNG